MNVVKPSDVGTLLCLGAQQASTRSRAKYRFLVSSAAHVLARGITSASKKCMAQ
jgi:hypothetical protein